MSRARSRLLRVFIPLTLLLVVSAPSADRTSAVQGDLTFASLDGSADDLDAAADGVWTVPYDAVLEGRLTCGDVRDCLMQIEVRGDFTILPGAAIEAGRLRLEATGDLAVREGAFVVSDAGGIELSARGQVVVDGLVSANGRAGRRKSSAAVLLESTGGPGNGIRVGTSGTVLSTGGGRGGNRVELSGCGLEVLGLVASVEGGPGAGVAMRSCEGLTVDGRDLTSSGSRRGRIEVLGSGSSRIDLFARHSIMLDGAELRAAGGQRNAIVATSDEGRLSWRRGRGEVDAAGAIRLTACDGVEMLGSRLVPRAEVIGACSGKPVRKDPALPDPGLVPLPPEFSGAAPLERPEPRIAPPPACIPNVAVDNMVLSGFAEFVACNTVSSTNTRIIPRGRVTYRAGQSIVLDSGFSVEGSAGFMAILDPTLNQPPVITSNGGGPTATIPVPENTTPVTDVDATDPEGDTEGGGGLTYALSGVDAAKFSIDVNSGVLDFVMAPDFDMPGDLDMDNDYEVSVTVTDSGGGAGVQDITVTVTNVNEPPTITSSAMQSAPENQTAVATLTATDPDVPMQTLTWMETGGADAAKLSITAMGVLSFDMAPDFESPGDADSDNVYEVDVKVDDGAGGMATQSVSVTVTDVNEAPVITSSAMQTAAENQTAVATLTATDQDLPMQTLTWTETGGADAAKLSLSAAGVLTFDMAPDFETKADANMDGAYEINVQVSDGAGGTTPQSLTVTVTDVNEPPTITSSAMQSAPENQTAVATLTATDPDIPAQTLTWTETGGADAAKLSITAGGALSFDMAPDFESPGDADSDNVYEIDVKVDDGAGGMATQSVSVTVTDVNEAPVITSSAMQTAAENQTAVATLTATDQDLPMQTLTWTETGGADAAKLSITAGGVLTFDMAPDFESPGDADSDNVYEIDVKVDDGAGGMATQSVSVSVTNVNETPTITSGASQTVPENQTAVATLTATDPDVPAQTLTWSETGGADAGLLSVTAGGVLSFDAAPDFESPGDADSDNVYDIDVKVDDGAGGMATQSVAVTVTNVNEAPTSGVDAFDFVGNTLLLVDKATTSAPEIIVTTGSTTGVLDNDSDPDIPPAALSITGVRDGTMDCADLTAPFTDCPTANAGKVTVESTGEFSYTPKTGDTAGSDSFEYKLSDGVNTVNVTVTLTRENRVWYVKNDNASGTDDGTSADPFDTLAEASTASLAGDTIFVFEGSGMTTGQDSGITLKSMQRLLGEGVALTVPDTVNGVPAPTLFAAGSRPAIEHATGTNDGVTVDATTGDRTGIEIRGLAISGTDNAIDVTASGAFEVGVTITDNLFDDSVKEAIDLNPGSSDDFIAVVEDNTFSTSSPTGDAIDVVTTVATGSVELAINRNTDITSSGGKGIDIDGTLGGNLVITGFADNTVHGATGGTGISILGATFDSDTSDADFDEVDAGTTTVGSGANPVGGSGVILGNSAAAANRVEGNLRFDQLDVFNSAGTGFGAAGTVIASGGSPPTVGFQVAVTTGTVAATGGPAVVGDSLTANGVTFASVSSTSSSTSGIELDSISGTLAMNGGAITGATGTAYDVGGNANSSGGNAIVSYAGSITNTSGRAVLIEELGGGSHTLSGTITHTGSNIGIQVSEIDNGTAATVTFSGPNSGINSGTSTAVNLVTNTNGTINFTGGGLDIDTTSGTGLNAIGGGTLNVTGANNLDSTTGSAVTMDAVTVGGSGVTFATIDKNATGGAAVGIDLNDVDGGTFSVTGSSAIAGTAAGTNNHGIDITGGSLATFTFASATIDSTGGAGINLNGANGAVTFTTVDIDGTGGAGIDIGSNTNAVNMNGGTIGASNDPAGNGVDINGGLGNVTVAAAITKTTAGEVVEVTNRTGGVMTFSSTISCNSCSGMNFSGNSGGSTTFSAAPVIMGSPSKVLDTGGNAALTVSSSGGHAISFTNGGLDIDTTSGNGIDVAGGGTIAISGPSPNNTITTTTGKGFEANGGGTVTVTGNAVIDTTAGTGTGVDIQSTTIGAAGVTFRSVSANGAANGIVLSSTGTSGGLTITGDGSNTRNASGGTIQNTTSHGIVLTSTDSFSATSLDLVSPGDGNNEHGINATNVTGSGNLFRSGRVSGIGFNADGIRIINTNTNLGLFEVRDSLFTGVNAGGNDGIFVNGLGTSQMRIDVLGSRATAPDRTTCTGTTTADVNQFDSIRGDGVQVNPENTSTITLNLKKSCFTTTQNFASDVSRFTSLLANSGTLKATIEDNVFQDTGTQPPTLPVSSSVGVVDFVANDSSTLRLRFRRNLIEDIDLEQALRIVGDDNTAEVDAIVDSNEIDDILDQDAIFLYMRDSTQLANISITNNDIGTGSDGAVGGTENPIAEHGIELRVQSRNIPPNTNDAMFAHVLISGNDIVNNDSSSESIDLESEVDNPDGTTVNPGATLNATVTSNGLKNLGGGDETEVDSEDGPVGSNGRSVICLDYRSNTLDGGSGVLQLDEDGGATLDVIQASPGTAGTGIDAVNTVGTVNVAGSPNYGAAAGACTQPTHASDPM